ncbi:MAG: SAM-dependent methyltransferase [Candidatus Omnitrophota bacterium]
MKSSSSQDLFLRSLLVNAMKNQSGSLVFSLLREEKGEISISWTAEDRESGFLTPLSEGSAPVFLTRDELPDAILRAWREDDDALYIEEGEKVLRLRRQGGSLIRETLDRKPQVLKNPLWAVGKAVYLHPNEAALLLQTIGLMAPSGEIKTSMRKKFKQVNHFLDLLSPLLEKNNDAKPYTVVDCGCGKSYLGFALYWHIVKTLKRKASFLGIDSSEKLIRDCQAKAERLEMPNMAFQCSPILKAEFPSHVDLVVSLHACDTATDEALACAVVHGARHIAAAPCCQHELAAQIEGAPMYPLAKHGLFKQRFAELLTDMARALCLEAHGYAVAAGEFIGAEETPKNLLLRASRGNPASEQRRREYAAFKQFYQISPSLDAMILEREAEKGK